MKCFIFKNYGVYFLVGIIDGAYLGAKISGQIARDNMLDEIR